MGEQLKGEATAPYLYKGSKWLFTDVQHGKCILTSMDGKNTCKIPVMEFIDSTDLIRI